jgi:hypothetical protein
MPEKLQNFASVIPLQHKLAALVWFLQQHRQEKLIVYFLTCATVDYMYAVLSELEVRERLLFGVFVMGRNPGCFWCAIFFHAWKSAWKEEIEDHFSVY